MLRGLNGPQREAVISPEGPVLVLAAAGSGKTRVLIARILYHAAFHGVDPGRICALTFSTKAAREMEVRLHSEGGKGLGDVFLGTFHALGLRIVRRFHREVGFAAPPKVLDTHGRLALLMGQVGDALARNQKFDPFELADTVSRLKDRGLNPEECPEDTPFGPRLVRIWKGYEKQKHKAGAVDFEDLLQLPLRLLREGGEPLAFCRREMTHLLVDEFQDTSTSQLEIVRLLAGPDSRAFVVGDDDQSIYGWRGADMQNVLLFESHFPNAALLKLEQNYRSTGHIIAAANAVVEKNVLRRAKTVFTDKDLGEPLNHYVADDEKSEQDFIVERLKHLRDQEGLDLRKVALLTRTNQQLREWMDLFIVHGIPYAVKGVDNLLDFPEVETVLAYAKAMVDPNDELALSRVLAHPKRGIPKDALRKIPRSDDEHGPSLQDGLKAYCESQGPAWSDAAMATLAALSRARSAQAPGDFVAPLRALLDEIQVLSAFEEGGRKRERIEEFLRLFTAREKRHAEDALTDHLGALALETQFEDDEEYRPGVRLMTVHAAKGLEWDTVFLPTLDDDVFPSKPNHTDTGIAEERRLFYVALTRARRRLYLSWPKTKVHYRVIKDVVPSRFLYDIPEACWDGPLGQKQQEDKQAFLTDFFANISNLFGDEVGSNAA
jgi:DNA helicase II / ATP-dependent DNA helicase PcrA